MHVLREQFEKIISLTDEEFNYVLSHFVYKKVKKNDYLVLQNNLVPNDFFVLSGFLKSYFLNEEGKEYILQFAMKDWWITDYYGYLNQTKAILNVDCFEEAEVLCLSLQNREKLCSEMHKIEHFFRKKSNSGYIGLQQRLLNLLNNNPQERYEKLVKQYPALVQKAPKALIASYLGVSRETLSRFNQNTKNKIKK
jgi:CRP-like cAMP-binding protein